MSEIYQNLQIKGYKGMIRVDALIDTGANVNAINYRKAIEIFDKKIIDGLFAKKIERVFVSKKITIEGVTILAEVVIRGQERATTFFVTKEDFGRDVLIGVPLLQQYKGYIDFVGDKLRFRKLSTRRGKWI